MDKLDYIEHILLLLKGTTGINYQLRIGELFKEYYKYIGKTYEMPDFYGGDKKNDGWVVEDGLFYQIFAPARITNTLRKAMHKKFTEDLEGLLKIIYEDKRWGEKIKSFVFLVNTIDTNLPQDSERFFEKKAEEYKAKYSISFDIKIVNTEYVRELLYNVDDIKVLERIAAILKIKHLTDPNGITEKIIIDLIMSISDNLVDKVIGCGKEDSYKRISSIEKININDLNEKRSEMETIISKLDIVERAINNINQDILCENNFERVKELIIKKYTELSCDKHGVELYEALIKEVGTCSGHKLDGAIKFLVVYIFDKCDIFEKSR